MQKIIHLITTISIGGAEKHLLMLAGEQARRGLDIEVIYLKGDPELSTEFTSKGVAVNGNFTNLSFILQCISIGKYLRRSSALVHSHLPRAELLTSIANWRNPVLASRHNSEAFYPGKNRYLSIIMSRIVSSRNRNIIAISDAVREFLIDSREVSEKTPIRVIHYGFNFVDSCKSPLKKTSNGSPSFGTISRLVPQKDLQTLLRAFSLFRQKHQTGSLKILGIGPELDSLKNLARELGVAQSIEFVPRTKDVKSFLSTLDVFLLTSKYEGFGLVLLEAIDAQIPIIATNSSAIPEVLGANFPGLVQVGDFQAISNQMSELLNLDQRELFLSKQNDRAKLFSVDQMASATAIFYDSVVDDWMQRRA